MWAGRCQTNKKMALVELSRNLLPQKSRHHDLQDQISAKVAPDQISPWSASAQFQEPSASRTRFHCGLDAGTLGGPDPNTGGGVNPGGGGKAEGAGGVNVDGINLGCTFGVWGAKSPPVPNVACGSPAAIAGAAVAGAEVAGPLAGPLAGPGGGILVDPPPVPGAEPPLI